jgi:hypothetical protein
MASNKPKAALLAGFGLAAALAAAIALPHTDAKAAAAAPKIIPPALTYAEIMRASVEVPAEGIWNAQGIEMPSEDEWLLMDEDTAQLVSAASLISLPGAGKGDAAKAAAADWQKWDADLLKNALDLRAAVKAKDKMKYDDLANNLTEVCQACHDKYRPQVPSDGISRYPFYPARTYVKK